MRAIEPIPWGGESMRATLSVAATLAALLLAVPVQAQMADGKVKIGVLTDLSGLYTDNTGTGSVLAAQMAVGGCRRQGRQRARGADLSRPPEQGGCGCSHRPALV